MSLPLTIFILIAFLALAVVAAGLLSSQKSIGVALFSLVVAVVSAGGAGYAWTESHSLPWTIGYGAIAVLSVASAARQLLRQSPAES